MKGTAGLVVLLAINVRLSQSCYGEGHILFCLNIPTAFPPGFSSLVMILEEVGEMNSTVLHSDDFTSVTRLRLEGAGVTAIVEGAFWSFQNLTNLSLKQNFLTEVNPNWFAQPDLLSELNLSENHIEVLTEVMLHGLNSLTRLNLSKNRIRTIEPDNFRSQSGLAELDLSENRMTQVSPQVFKSLMSTRIRLDGNPWDCSCGAEDLDFLKDLQNRSLLIRQLEVTCESPPSVTGQPVWNVSACLTSPPPRPPAGSQTVQPKPTDVFAAVPPSTALPPTSETRTSDGLKPANGRPATPTPPVNTGTYVTSPPSPPPEATDLPSLPHGVNETCVTSPTAGTNDVCNLAVVIVILSLLLFMMCCLVVLHRRKRTNKTVMPGCPEENRKESIEDGSRLSREESPGDSKTRENSDLESRRSFTTVRAKSANDFLLTTPRCPSLVDHVTLQTETEVELRDQENQNDGKKKPAGETHEDGGFETDHPTNTTAGGLTLGEDHLCDVSTDTVPFLNIGANQITSDFRKESTEGQRSQMKKVMGRISTWPPTAVQWQARCKKMEEEGRVDAFTVGSPQVPAEMEKALNKVGLSCGEEQIEKNDTEDQKSSKPKEKTSAFSADMKQAKKMMMIKDPADIRQTTPNLNQEQLCQDQDLEPTGENTNTEKKEIKHAGISRQWAENRTTGAKAPSGGTSPDDESPKSGNLDLLHEVVHNNGRWTRERWRQTQVNKQRYRKRGADRDLLKV